MMVRMGAVDSGNETLLSDDSSLEAGSPDSIQVPPSRIPAPQLPPRIQPYSGVLGSVSLILIHIAKN